MVQGFSTGGEYGGATTFIAEYSPDKRRGFMGFWLEFGTLAGFVLGAAVVTAMKAWVPREALLDWGWRVPFLVAGPLGAVGLYLRLKLEETPAFQKHADEVEKRGKLGEPFLEMFTKLRRALLICVGSCWSSTSRTTAAVVHADLPIVAPQPQRHPRAAADHRGDNRDDADHHGRRADHRQGGAKAGHDGRLPRFSGAVVPPDAAGAHREPAADLPRADGSGVAPAHL
jgi:hypothetical protein